MALFPSSPSNGTTATVNGISYTFYSSQTAWVRTGSGSSGDFAVTGNASISGNTSIGGALTVSGLSNLGPNSNVVITGGTNGQYLQTNGSGGLSWATVSGGTGISNGTSNISIPASSGNINTSVAGNANIFIVTGTGANVTGTLNATGNANVGNIGATAGVFTGNVTVSGNISNTRINTRIANNGATTSGTITPNADTSDQYNLIGLNGTVTIAAPSGTFTDGQKLTLRIKDSGSAQTLNWTTGSANNYRVIGTTLPTTTTAGKVTYVGCVYNSQDTYWDVVAVTTQA